VILWPLVSWSAWAQQGTVLAGTSGEDAAQVCSLGRRGPRQPLWWRLRQVRALLWSLVARSALTQPAIVVLGTTGEGSAMDSVFWSAWSQPATLVLGTKVEGAALASSLLICVGPANHCGGGYDW
jgi:hypothetical protein